MSIAYDQLKKKIVRIIHIVNILIKMSAKLQNYKTTKIEIYMYMTELNCN